MLLGERHRRCVPDGIDGAVNPVQAASRDPMRDRPAVQAGPGELSAGHEPALPAGDPCDRRVARQLAGGHACRRFGMTVVQKVRYASRRPH